MSNALLDELEHENVAALSEARKEYASILSRAEKPQKGDVPRLKSLMQQFQIDAATLGQHIAAIAQVRERQKIIDAGKNIEKETAALATEIDDFNVKYNAALAPLNQRGADLNARQRVLDSRVAQLVSAEQRVAELKSEFALAFGEPDPVPPLRPSELDVRARADKNEERRIANDLAAFVRDAGESGIGWHCLKPDEFESLKSAVAAGWIERPLPAAPKVQEPVEWPRPKPAQALAQEPAEA
jgi:hypothetical protein